MKPTTMILESLIALALASLLAGPTLMATANAQPASESQPGIVLPPDKCPTGYYFNPVTHRCVPSSPVPSDGPRTCPYGYHMDPVTLRCVPDIPSTPWAPRPLPAVSPKAYGDAVPRYGRDYAHQACLSH